MTAVKLLAEEPTPEMVDAGWSVANRPEAADAVPRKHYLGAIFRAMWAAAPGVPQALPAEPPQDHAPADAWSQDVAMMLAEMGASVDKLLQQAGYTQDSSARHQLAALRSRTAAALAALQARIDAMAKEKERDDFKRRWYQSNRNLHAAWDRAEQAERELAEADKTIAALRRAEALRERDLATARGKGGEKP